MRRLLLTTAFVAIASWLAGAQTRTGPVLFEGARLVTGERTRADRGLGVPR